MLNDLLESINEVCPCVGVAGTAGDSSSIRIDYAENATQEQRDAARALVDSFDWSPEAAQGRAINRKVREAATLLSSYDSLPQAVRVVQRVICDRINAAFRAMGQPAPLLEADIFEDVQRYMQQGWSLPGPRPD